MSTYFSDHVIRPHTDYPIDILNHECRCWANQSTTIVAHAAMFAIVACRVGSTIFWNGHVVCPLSFIMWWCKFFDDYGQIKWPTIKLILHQITFLYVSRFFMVFTCLALSVFSTIKEYEEDALYILFRMEILVVIWFTMEFVLRWDWENPYSRFEWSLWELNFVV